MILSLIAIWVLALVSLAGYLWLLVLAFKKSTVWGLAVFFIPFVSLYFSIKFWSETKKPFLIHTGASVGLIVMSVISFFFALSGAQPVDSNVQLSQPVMQGASQASQSRLSQEEQMALVFMEKTIEVMEKLPSDEKQKETLKVMRKFIQLQKTGFSVEEVHKFRVEIETVLNRTDLNKNQRANMEKMLDEVRKKEGPVFTDLQLSADIKRKADAMIRGISTQSEATPVALKAPVVKKRSVVVPRVSENEPDFAQKDAPPRFRHTSFVQAKNHIGSAVRFTDPRGEEKNCVLLKIADKNLHCRKEFASGNFSFSYHQNEIKSLKVLR